MNILKKISIFSFLFMGMMFTAMQSSSQKILFLTLKIERDKVTQLESISIVNKFLVDGQLKQTNHSNSIPQKSVLVLSFLSENEKIINQIEIENPISKNVEYFDVDGTIQRHNIEENQVEFNIRVNYEDSMKMLRISKKETQKQTYIISNIILKL